MSYPCHFCLALHDRGEIDRFVGAVNAGHGASWDIVVQHLLSMTVVADGHGCRVYCVQRHAHFLGDHTIEENWKLPLWESAADDPVEWGWLLSHARAMFALYSNASPSSYPAQLDEVSLLAAQFCQAHIMMPEILLLDSVLSNWHHTDQAKVGRMIHDYAGRYPLRALVHVDVTEPPPGVLPFSLLELEHS